MAKACLFFFYRIKRKERNREMMCFLTLSAGSGLVDDFKGVSQSFEDRCYRVRILKNK